MPAISTSKRATLLCLLSLRMVAAHEHHDDKIPEGHPISPDPIVKLPALAANSMFADTVYRMGYCGYISSHRSLPLG